MSFTRSGGKRVQSAELDYASSFRNGQGTRIMTPSGLLSLDEAHREQVDDNLRGRGGQNDALQLASAPKSGCYAEPGQAGKADGSLPSSPLLFGRGQA